MDHPQPLPIAEIDPQALLRDRTALDPAALSTLRASIATEGLRLPIEVFELADPAPHRYGLISGLRRLTACQTLGHSTIPAYLRRPASIPEAMAAMVSENENRSPVSPWEKGNLIVTSVMERTFDTFDAAIAALYPLANRQTRSRLRGFASVVEALDGHLTAPESIPTHRLDRLAAALRGGLEERFIEALGNVEKMNPEAQWHALTPVITQALLSREDPPPEGCRTRPRQRLHLTQGLTIRREPSRGGWILRFTGPEAKSGGLVDDVLDEVERLFQKR